MLVSYSLHNSLIILSCFLFALFLSYIFIKQLKRVWNHINIIRKLKRNVLLLQSSELSQLTNILSSTNDYIQIHPRQIRRMLRQALDSNIVKDVPISKPTLHYLSQPRRLA